MRALIGSAVHVAGVLLIAYGSAYALSTVADMSVSSLFVAGIIGAYSVAVHRRYQLEDQQ